MYSYFLGAIYFLFGHNYLIPRVIQALLGALSAWLIFRLGSRVFDRKVGLAAGIIFGLYGPLIFFTGELLVHTLDIFWITIFLLTFDLLLDRPTKSRFLISGILLGLCALTHPTILIFSPIAIVWMIVRLKERGRGLALFIAGAALAILPVTLRNYTVGKDFVLISAQAGVNFFMGNNPCSNGHTAWVPGTPKDWWAQGYPATIRIAERAAGRELKPSQVSSYWWHRTLREISGKPLTWANLMLKKSRYLLAGHEISNTEDIYFQSRFSGLLNLLLWEKVIAFPFGLILPLGMLGLASNLNWRRQAHLILFQLSYAIAIVFFFVTARYRLGLVPITCLWAAAGLVGWACLLRQKPLGKHFWTAVAFLLLLIFINRNPLRGEEIPGLDGHINLGNKYLEKNQPEKALAAFQQAEKAGPLLGNPANGAALALLRLGRTQEARAELEKAVLLDPSLIQAHNNLARILEQGGDLDGAQKHYASVLQLDSSNVFALQGYADVALGKEDYSTAETHYELAYRLGCADRQVISRWALALLQQSKYADALRVNAKLLMLEPENARAHHNQARIYIACDSLELAAKELEIVLKLAPETEAARRQLEEIRKAK